MASTAADDDPLERMCVCCLCHSKAAVPHSRPALAIRLPGLNARERPQWAIRSQVTNGSLSTLTLARTGRKGNMAQQSHCRYVVQYLFRDAQALLLHFRLQFPCGALDMADCPPPMLGVSGTAAFPQNARDCTPAGSGARPHSAMSEERGDRRPHPAA